MKLFFTEHVFEETQQVDRRRWPTIQGRKEYLREPLHFNEDAAPEPDAKGLYPLLAWTLIWKGIYGNLYGS